MERGQQAGRDGATLEFCGGGLTIPTGAHTAHGLQGELEAPDWPPLTLAEVDQLLRRFPQAGGANQLLSRSPRPFSAASLVATPQGRAFVKRHSSAVRDREGLLEEHRLLAALAASLPELVQAPLADQNGETAISLGPWTYEVHPAARGVDIYEQAPSWTPFLGAGHARVAGQALGQLHRAAASYDAPARKPRQLVSSFSIFACPEHVRRGAEHARTQTPAERMEFYLERRPILRAYAEQRHWRSSFDECLMPWFRNLEPWLPYLAPLWTHNDFHASNLMWSGDGEDAAVTAIVDFGLADRTNAVHDLATAIERNIVEWLRIDESCSAIVHLDHLDALLAGYEAASPLSAKEAQALTAILPLVHCEFALSEADYFLTILGSPEKADLAYDGYFLGHARWFSDAEGQRLLAHLEQWAGSRTRERSANRPMAPCEAEP